jgi:hypothetical protein
MPLRTPVLSSPAYAQNLQPPASPHSFIDRVYRVIAMRFISRDHIDYIVIPAPSTLANTAQRSIGTRLWPESISSTVMPISYRHDWRRRGGWAWNLTLDELDFICSDISLERALLCAEATHTQWAPNCRRRHAFVYLAELRPTRMPTAHGENTHLKFPMHYAHFASPVSSSAILPL